MNRKTLFLKSKPILRPFVSHEGEDLGPDMGILWAAYKRGSFNFQEMSEKKFIEFILTSLGRYASCWIMEDQNKGFRSGIGPVCLVTIHTNGWKILPEVHWFSWANTRNRLRCTVGFIQKTRHDKTVGAAEFRCQQDGVKLLEHTVRFVPTLRYVGKVWFGTPTGDQYIFSIKGAKNAGADGRGKDAEGVQRDGAGEQPERGSEERQSSGTGQDVQSLEERHGDQ